MSWFRREKKNISLETLIDRLETAFATSSGETVTPDTALNSPTVHAIVTAVSRRIAVSPIRVMRKSMADGRERKELLPDHPVARLLRRPNGWQDSTTYWLDAVSSLVRYGAFFAFKSRPVTGPVQQLIPLPAHSVHVEQNDRFELKYRHHTQGGQTREYSQAQVHYVRGPSRDFVQPDSPVMAVRESIALELAAEKFAAAFFGNGALPLVIFKAGDLFQGFRDQQQQDDFRERFKEAFSGKKRFAAMVLPKGMEMEQVEVEQDKAQFIETRKLIRTVIASAWNVPPHLVGDLERATFNNVEQQDKDFVINAVMPVARTFEDAMERDLLTDTDRRSGVVIRFNLDSVQRADFKSRQEGLWIQRQAGVITPNDWRERENLNPISPEDGGDTFIMPGNMVPQGEAAEPEPDEDDEADTPPLASVR